MDKNKELIKFNKRTAQLLTQYSIAIQQHKNEKAVWHVLKNLWEHVQKAKVRDYEFSEKWQKFFSEFDEQYQGYLFQRGVLTGNYYESKVIKRYGSNLMKHTCYILNQDMVVLDTHPNIFGGFISYLRFCFINLLQKMGFARFVKGFETNKIILVRGFVRLEKLTGLSFDELIECLKNPGPDFRVVFKKEAEEPAEEKEKLDVTLIKNEEQPDFTLSTISSEMIDFMNEYDGLLEAVYRK